jgi:hypothetical protein
MTPCVFVTKAITALGTIAFPYRIHVQPPIAAQMPIALSHPRTKRYVSVMKGTSTMVVPVSQIHALEFLALGMVLV